MKLTFWIYLISSATSICLYNTVNITHEQNYSTFLQCLLPVLVVLSLLTEIHMLSTMNCTKYCYTIICRCWVALATSWVYQQVCYHGILHAQCCRFALKRNTFLHNWCRFVWRVPPFRIICSSSHIYTIHSYVRYHRNAGECDETIYSYVPHACVCVLTIIIVSVDLYLWWHLKWSQITLMLKSCLPSWLCPAIKLNRIYPLEHVFHWRHIMTKYLL